MKNHIFLVIGFFQELKDLTMAQRLIDIGRSSRSDDTKLQSALDEKQAEVNEKRNRIYEQMFEIPRSN